jgi:hypothetical protein
MFRLAYEKACKFTFPVVQFWSTLQGKCGAGIAAFIVVNSDGWIVTAAHVANDAAKLAKADNDARVWEQARDAIKADQSISAKERSRKLAALGNPDKTAVRRAANLWAFQGSNLIDVTVVSDVDLAVGRLSPFDPNLVSDYAIFKDPAKITEMRPGTSLCKLGYPFPELKPTFDDASNSFFLAARYNYCIFSAGRNVPSRNRSKAANATFGISVAVY